MADEPMHAKSKGERTPIVNEAMSTCFQLCSAHYTAKEN